MKQDATSNGKFLIKNAEERKKLIARKAKEIYELRKGEKRGKKYVTYGSYYQPDPYGRTGEYIEIDDAKEDWYEAEKAIDKAVFDQELESDELYQALMVRFYSIVDVDRWSDEEVAKQYLDHIHWNRQQVDRVGQKKIHSQFDFRNVALMMNDTDIAFLTKRALLLSDTTLLSHATDHFIYFKSESAVRDITYNVDQDAFYETNCPSLKELGFWLKNARPLIESGELFYYPQIRIYQRVTNTPPALTGLNLGDETPIYNDHIFDAVVRSRKFVERKSASVARTKLIQSVVQIEIPYIENVDLSTFSKISRDEHIHLEKFRDHLREHFLELASIDGSDTFDSKLAKIGLNIKNGASSLANDIRRLENKTAWEAVGAGVLTLTATLVVISAVPAAIATLLGSGGGIAALIKQLTDYEEKRSKLEDSPHYFIWLLGQ